MANEQLSTMLAAVLNDKVINEAFMTARSNRTGILSTVGFGASRVPFEGYKLSWLDSRIDADGSYVNGAKLSTDTTITVDNGDKFRAGMLVSAEGSDEVILVTAVSGNDLTVTRGFGGTTAAALADNVALIVDSVGREENSLAQNDGIYQPTPVENFFQTFDTAVEFSRRALSTIQFGNTNDIAYQISQRIAQLTIQMDRALVKGRKATATVGGKSVSYTGGMKYFLDQSGAIKVDNSAAALTLSAINDLNAEIVKRGGVANTVAVGVAKARKINDLVGANYNSARLADWTADEGSVLTLPSDLPLVGNVTRIVIDTNLNDNELVMFDSNMINIIPMGSGNANEDGNWRTKDATAQGQDGIRTRIIGDFGMEIRQSQTHLARLHNIG